MTASVVSLQESRGVSLDDACEQVRRKGYVIFERLLPDDLLAEMYRVWAEYFVPFSQQRPGARRLIMYTPFKRPLYDPRFVEHPLVLQVVDALLGKRYISGYFASETPLPGAAYQPVHFDYQCFNWWSILNGPLELANKLLGSCHYAYAIQVSVPLVDSRADNAPLEIWPGSHRLTWRRTGPERLLMPAGSILVRDLRTLHRGTPHLGSQPRPFLSVAYVRSWVPQWRLPEIPLDVYHALPERSQRLFARAAIGQAVPTPEAWARRDS